MYQYNDKNKTQVKMDENLTFIVLGGDTESIKITLAPSSMDD